jgi:hypothetical protein
MLKHVIKAQILDRIVRSVNMLIRVRKIRFNNKSRGVASFGGRGVIRAGVAALCLNVWNITVLTKD